MKKSWRWLLAGLALFVVTPFAVFPEIMGDVGPRNVPLWRNALGIALLAAAVLGIVFSAAQIVIARVKNSRA